MADVEVVTVAGTTLALIVRRDFRPERTTFVTDDDAQLQIGLIVYPKDAVIARHVHLPIVREVVGTPEAIVVRRGRCLVDLYTDAEEPVTTRELAEVDVIVLLRGGHGFRLLEDTVLLEVKQGPFVPDDKRRF